MASDFKKYIKLNEKFDYGCAKNLHEINNNLSVEPNVALEIESSMMLEEFCNANNQGLLPENFLKLVRLDSNIY